MTERTGCNTSAAADAAVLEHFDRTRFFDADQGFHGTNPDAGRVITLETCQDHIVWLTLHVRPNAGHARAVLVGVLERAGELAGPACRAAVGCDDQRFLH